MGRKKKQYLICKKDYSDFMLEEDLLAHGYTVDEILENRPSENSWNIFVKGERYEHSGSVGTMGGDKIVFVETKIKISKRSDGMMHSEKFFVNEFNESEMDKWCLDVKKYEHLPDQIKKDFPSFFNPPKKEPLYEIILLWICKSRV